MSRGEQAKSGMATAALVLGIIGVVLAFVPIVNNAAFVLGVLALIFAIITLVKKQKVAMSVVALILAIASVGITIGMQKVYSDAFNKAVDGVNKSLDDMSGDNTDEILKNDVSVELGEFTAKTDEYGLSSSKLPVTVTNKLGEKKSFSVKIEAVAKDGSRIDDDTIYANDLNAGQSQSFDAFTLVQSDKFEALKGATFKILSVSKV